MGFFREERFELSPEVKELCRQFTEGSLEKKDFKKQFCKTEQWQEIKALAKSREQKAICCTIEKRELDDELFLYVPFEPD